MNGFQCGPAHYLVIIAVVVVVVGIGIAISIAVVVVIVIIVIIITGVFKSQRCENPTIRSPYAGGLTTVMRFASLIHSSSCPGSGAR